MHGFRSYVYTACQSICDSLAESARITKDVKNYLQIKLSKLSLPRKEYQKNKLVSSEFPALYADKNQTLMYSGFAFHINVCLFSDGLKSKL